MQKVSINLYELSELNQEAKRRAIKEHKQFLIDMYQDNDYDESFNMTQSKYAKQLLKVDIIESIEINEYLFFSDGSMAQTCLYIGSHINAGKHIFTFKNVDYDLNGKGLLAEPLPVGYRK